MLQTKLWAPDMYTIRAPNPLEFRGPRNNEDTTKYMKPSETWGRMPAKILSGDFYQLPPVPATASLLASPSSRSYEQQQGRKLLSDMEYVVDFVNMQRFHDPLLVHILEAMRTPGGQKISEEVWQALKATTIRPAAGGASQPAAIGAAGADARLKEARGWYECAYEWRIVSYAMHAHARLNAKAASKLLFYVPAIDAPAARIPKEAFDEMRALPNIGTSAKFPGILPIFVGMEMILTESFLPPRIVRGTPVEVVDIEVHPKEPPVQSRASIASHGCVLLHYMPRCIYVRVRGCTDVFLGPAAGAAQPGAAQTCRESSPCRLPRGSGCSKVRACKGRFPCRGRNAHCSPKSSAHCMACKAKPRTRALSPTGNSPRVSSGNPSGWPTM